jgi:hypothetical protein
MDSEARWLYHTIQFQIFGLPILSCHILGSNIW